MSLKSIFGKLAIGGAVYLLIFLILIFIGKPETTTPKEENVGSNVSAIENMESVWEVLEYILSEDDFKNCKREDLEEYQEVIRIDSKMAEFIQSDLNGMTGGELFDYALKVADDFEPDLTAHDREHIMMHLLDKAAEEEFPEAMNEVGASMLYCYQHVRQDLPTARFWLEKAADAGDELAMLSLGRIYLGGLGVEQDKSKGLVLIKQCSDLGVEECQKILKEEMRESKSVDKGDTQYKE
jgi:TPR repeat protein